MQPSGWTPPFSDIAEAVENVTSPEFTSAPSGIISEEKVVRNAPACLAPTMVNETNPIIVASDADGVQSVRSSGSSSQNARAAELKAKRAELELANAKEHAKCRARGRTTRTHRRQRNAFTLFGGLHKEQTNGTSGLQLKYCIAWQGSGATHTRPYECTALLECGVTVHYQQRKETWYASPKRQCWGGTEVTRAAPAAEPRSEPVSSSSGG